MGTALGFPRKSERNGKPRPPLSEICPIAQVLRSPLQVTQAKVGVIAPRTSQASQRGRRERQDVEAARSLISSQSWAQWKQRSQHPGPEAPGPERAGRGRGGLRDGDSSKYTCCEGAPCLQAARGEQGWTGLRRGGQGAGRPGRTWHAPPYTPAGI